MQTKTRLIASIAGLMGAAAVLIASSSQAADSAAVTNAPAYLPVPVHIIADGNRTTNNGVVWLAPDKFFPDGDVIERPGINIATSTNTGPAFIYQSERYSMSKFVYSPVTNGDYTLKLHFCETYEGISGKGERVFTYAVKGNGAPVKDFDVFATGGGALKPVVKTIPITVTNNVIQVDFTPQVENPQINGVEIFPGH
jgi:endoglucanase